MEDYLSKSEIALRALRQMITSGQITPGQRLKLGQLSRMLGVSITPIREAIRILEAEGVLHGMPYRGVSVGKPTADEMEDICRIRSVLEALATRQAVSRSEPAALASTLAGLQELQSRMESCVESGVLSGIGPLNRKFHLSLYDLCRSPYLMDMIRRLWAQLPGYVWENPALSVAIVQQHKPIVEAVRAGLSDAAGRAMQTHIDLSAAMLLQGLRDLEVRNSAPAH